MLVVWVALQYLDRRVSMRLADVERLYCQESVDATLLYLANLPEEF